MDLTLFFLLLFVASHDKTRAMNECYFTKVCSRVKEEDQYHSDVFAVEGFNLAKTESSGNQLDSLEI